MPTFSNIDGEESATVTFTVAAVSLDRNSSAELQEILCIGDPDISTNVARVLPTAPGTTESGLIVRQVGYSTTVQVSSLGGAVIVRSSAADMAVTATPASGQRFSIQSTAANAAVNVLNSTYGDITVRAAQSTASDLLATVTPASGVRFSIQSTAANAGVNPLNSTYGDLTVRAAQSTASDLLVTASQGTTAWSVLSRQTTSSGGSVEGSTQTAPLTAIGLHVRPVPSSVNSTSVVVTSSNSTVLLPVLSSAAVAQRVHAYFVGVSTVTSPSTLIFMSGSTNHVWGLVMSSLVWGANLAVNAPSELFRANAGDALNVVLQNASTAVTARISLGWRADT